MAELNKIRYDIKEIISTSEKASYDVTIKIPLSFGWLEGVKFLIESDSYRDAYPMKHLKNDKEYAYFQTKVTLPTKALYHYYFSFQANNEFYYYKKRHQDSIHHISREDMWKMSVNFEVPEWAQGGMIYQIFVDRYCRGSNNPPKEMKNRILLDWKEDIRIGPDENGQWNTDFYGGDLKGIIQNLDYIKSLGVTILYLCPIVMSQSNHRYDTADYENIDPYAGTKEDLRILCREAHKRGMKVVLDAVFNHTGNDSKYFNQYGTFPNLGAYQSKESIYYPFYRKHEVYNQPVFDYWWDMPNLPVCDGTSKEWQNYICGEGGIIDQWFSLGIDGLRLDVADELTDEFIEKIRIAVKRNKHDGFILGEVWKNPMKMNRGYLESGKGMDTVMNYPLVDGLIRYYKYIDQNTLKRVLNEMFIDYPEGTLNSLMNFTSTHDISRIINIFSCDEFDPYSEWGWNLRNNDREWQKAYRLTPEQYEKGKEIYKSYLYALSLLPGNLSIFYGDEAGLQGMGNLPNRRPYPWGMEDKDLIRYVQWIGRIIKRERPLKLGDSELVNVTDNYFQYRRENEREDALITVSRSGEQTDFKIPNYYQDADMYYPLGNSSRRSLDSHGGIVLKKTK